MKGKPKILQEWQVYHQMTYESQWKAVIDDEWEKYKSTWEAENAAEELDVTRFMFMASFMRQKYLEETEEVQNKVKRRREELKEELEIEGEDKNVDYQKYSKLNVGMLNHNSPSCSTIDRLPRTLAVWGESIRKQTGWNISFLVGGPAPCQNGKIMTYMYDTRLTLARFTLLTNIFNFRRLHCGNSQDGQDFRGFLGADEYDKHIITPFDDFLHEAFCK